MKTRSLLLLFSIACSLLMASFLKAQDVKWYPVAAPAPKKDNAKIIMPAARDYNAYSGVPLKVLFNHWLRDPNMLSAPDGYFYMVGTSERSSLPQPLVTSERSNGWWYNDGIPLWRSKDLVNWETMGYVWSLEKDATWAKEYKYSPHTKTDDNAKVRAVWAPEIHYIKGNYWITYSMNYNGTGILKSISGKPEGPYRDIKTDGSLGGDIDSSLFEDTDGTVYYMTDGYDIARMKPDMSGLAENLRRQHFTPQAPWAEGITMMRVNDRYIWIGAGNTIVEKDGKEMRTYDCFSATSSSPYGPFEDRYRAIAYAGHNNIFKDHDGNLWSTQFHPQPHMEKALEPAIIPVTMDEEGYITIRRTTPSPEWKYTTTKPQKNWINNDFNDKKWITGKAGFGNPEIRNTGTYTDVATKMEMNDIWMRKAFEISGNASKPALFLRYTGDIKIWINGQEIYKKSNIINEYETVPVSASILKSGSNIIAVAFTNKADLSYVDIGLVDLP